MPCCDLCVRTKQDRGDGILSDQESSILKLLDRINSRTNPDTIHEVIDVDHECTNMATHAPQRRTDRLQACRDALNRWRDQCWEQHLSDCTWGPKVLLSDPVITKLATRAHITTIESLKSEIPEWDFAGEYGIEVLTTIQDADTHWKEMHQRELQARKENRRAEKLSKAVPPKMTTTHRPALQPTPIWPAQPPYPTPAPIPFAYPIAYPSTQVPQGFPGFPHPMVYPVQYHPYPMPSASSSTQMNSQPCPPPTPSPFIQYQWISQPGYPSYLNGNSGPQQ